jgi:hypothetical protein
VIAGKATLSDVTADFIAGRIATLSVLNVAAISSTGNISTSNGFIMAPYYYLGTSGNALNMASSIRALRITRSGNTYTLQKQDYDDSDWVNVDSFSRATTLSGVWSGNGKLTVTASPQDETYERLLVAKAPSEGYIPVYAQWGSSGQYEEDTGLRVAVPSSNVTLEYDEYNNPSSDTTGRVYAKLDGTAVVTKAVNMNVGSWSSGKVAVNARIGTTSGNVTSRKWVDVPTPGTFNVTNTKPSTTKAGSVSGVTTSDYLTFKCGGKDFYIEIS